MPEQQHKALEPCPFCAHIGVSVAEQSTYRWGAAVCDGCGAVGPEIRKSYGEDESEWGPHAIAAWNRRPANAELRRLHAENEALRKERDEMLLLLADPPSSRSK